MKRISGRRRVYCSARCKMKWLNAKRNKVLHEDAVRRLAVGHPCAMCGVKCFDRRLGGAHVKYCDTCRVKAEKEQSRAYTASAYERGVTRAVERTATTCRQCGVSVVPKKVLVGGRLRCTGPVPKYCSRRCRRRWHYYRVQRKHLRVLRMEQREYYQRNRARICDRTWLGRYETMFSGSIPPDVLAVLSALRAWRRVVRARNSQPYQ